MVYKKCFPTFSCCLLLIFLVQACQGADLLCYVCSNCPKITAETPLQTCNEDFFNSGGSTLPATMTTTTPAATTEITTESTTTTTTTEITTTPITTTEKIDDTTTTEMKSTTPQMPTPPTIGPPVTTTAAPTPPNVGTEAAPINELELALNETRKSNNTTTVLVPLDLPSTTVSASTPTQLPVVVRQRRQAMNNGGVTYHCYRVQKKNNGTMVTERGCTRVTTDQAVCTELASMNNGTTLSKCFPCSNSRCNGSTTIGVSIMAILIAAIAALLNRD